MSLSKLKQKIKQNKQIHDFAIWIITPPAKSQTAIMGQVFF